MSTERLVYESPVLPLDEELDEYVDKLVEANELLPRVEQSEAWARISADKPVAIAFTGDWHIGQKGTNYKLLREDNQLLAATPGLYVIGMGDYRHNAKAGRGKTANALYEALIPDPNEQQQVAMRELRRLKGKLLGLVRGCHDDWDYQAAGIRSLTDLCVDLHCMSFWHGAVLHLTIGKTEYHILARHKYGSNSANSTSAQRRAYDEYPEDERLDIVALAHFHYPDLQMRTRGGSRKVVYLRSGSYFRQEEFGQKAGGYKGIPGVPVVVLYPDTKKMVPFEGSNLGLAIDFLRAQRA